MANEQNLQPKPFTSEYQPANRGRKKGVPNRATVLKKLLAIKINVANPTNKNEQLNVTLHEAAALGQIQSAMKGNTNAWKEIQDSLYGKQANINEISGANGGAIEHAITGKLDLAIDKIYGDDGSK